MQPSLVTGYRLDAVHAFRVRTLASLGYRTRVALGNASHTRQAYATPYRVDVSVCDGPGGRRILAEGVARIAPRERVVLECEAFSIARDRDVEIVFHLVPESLLPGDDDGTVTLPRDQLYFYLTVQDHYVEHHRSDGFCAGVLYQSGAFNYPLFSKEASTLIQAPKCFVSDRIDTLVSLVNSSADPAWSTTADVHCALVAPSGALVTDWVETLPPFGLALVSLRARLRAAAVEIGTQLRFFCLHAVCSNATLLPITIQRDDHTGAIGLEHSLPPIYYAEAARGPLRSAAIAGFDALLERARGVR